MKTKQWIWLIIAAVVFIIGGTVSVLINTWSAGVYGNILSDTVDFTPTSPYIAQINVEGTISDSSTSSLYSDSTYNQDFLLDTITALQYDENNVGILLYIDSPGGELGASDELYLTLMDYKENTGRPIYAYFGDYACSGAYYIAMAADEIWANRNSTCVNIGVYISTYNFSELFDKYGIEQIMIRSSENKGIGSIGIEWTDEQLEIYQSMVDLDYEQFVEIVAEGRAMTTDQVKKRNDGREMLACQALEAGFIDGIGRYDDYAEQVLSYFDEYTTLYEEEQPEASLMDRLTGLLGMANQSSDTDLSVLQDFMATGSEGIRVMAYAG